MTFARAVRFARALRAVTRFEARQIRRHRGRAALVVLLVAIPVAALVGGSSLLAIVEPTPAERRAAVLGAAALRVDPGARELELRELIPADARIERLSTGREELPAPGRRFVARAIACDADGLASGKVRVLEGRAPRASDEVALSPVLRRALSRSIGDVVELSRGSARVTGIVVDPEQLDAPVILRRAADGEPGDLLVAPSSGEGTALAARLREHGFEVACRGELGQRDAFEAIALFVIGGFGFFEAALVIAAAFAVSMRRRQRELGLLAANGAGAADLRAAFVASALLLASIGGGVGVVVGAGAARLVHPFLDGWNNRWNGAFELSAQHVVGAIALGLIATVIAALVPAWSATRLPIRVALSGRRPTGEDSRAWLLLGSALVVGGAAVVAIGARASGVASALGILGGSIACALGLGAGSPALLGALARVAAPLPLAWRLAARDAGRFRARNGPVVTAVLAGMSVCVMLASLARSIDARIGAGPRSLPGDVLLVDGPDAGRVAAMVSSQLGGVALAPWVAASLRGELVLAGGTSGGWIALGGGELLNVLGLERAVDDLRAGRVIALAGDAASEIELAAGGAVIARLPVARHPLPQRLRAPTYVVGENQLGLAPAAPPIGAIDPWLVRLAEPVSIGALDRARGIAAEYPGASVDAELAQRASGQQFLAVVLALALATGLILVFTATALSSVEAASDARTLRTIGASPAVLSLHSAARAGYLASLGCALAIPAGLIPSAGLVRLANVALEFAIPWGVLAIVALGLPVLAFSCAWLVATLRRGVPANVR